jgi:hypothetical protein
MNKLLLSIILLMVVCTHSNSQDWGNEISFGTGTDDPAYQTVTLYDPVAMKYRLIEVSITPKPVRNCDPAKLYRAYLSNFSRLSIKHEFQKFYPLDENGAHKSYLLTENYLVEGESTNQTKLFKLRDHIDLAKMPRYQLIRSPEFSTDRYQIN